MKNISLHASPSKGNPTETQSCQNPFLPVANPFRSTLTVGSLQGSGKLLRYDSELDGYRSDISGNRLKGAPKHGSELFEWTARRAELDDDYNDEVIRPG